MLWRFRYRDKFSGKEAVCEAPTYDLAVNASKAWCSEHGRLYVAESVSRFVQFTVNADGTRIEHDVTGQAVEKPAEPKAKKAKESAA